MNWTPWPASNCLRKLPGTSGRWWSFRLKPTKASPRNNTSATSWTFFFDRNGRIGRRNRKPRRPEAMGLARGLARLVGRPPFGFSRQVFQNFSVGAREGAIAQLIQRTPAAGLNCPGQSIGKFGAKDIQRYPIARDGMADPKQRFEGARAGAEEPFSELTNVAMIEGAFEIRTLPQARLADAGWPSA